ncbi:putative isxo2-like transposase domain protein [Caerostris extrusa]|uniref:Isxo2-like transposase domain protein n=1 Tax=Caerostris extrusa TaxID=172846 RepID=A0AAV4XDD4_CAEEX|nr:putative isxo2-like transposase domain protein [Caerostris extrusa]
MNLTFHRKCVLMNYLGMPPMKKQKMKTPTNKNKNYVCLKAFELHTLLTENLIEFCQELKLIASSVMCYCGEPMAFAPRMERSDGYQWRCKKRKLHNIKFSIRAGTWFGKSKISIREILWICYMWVYEYSISSMLHECEHTKQTLVEWCSNCQNACQKILENKRNLIGGSDKLVEFFSCIYQNEKESNSQKWVMCAIEQFSTNVICLVVPNKESNTLLEIFDHYILPGTTVFGQIWDSLRDLSHHDFEYLTVDKEITFHDSVTRKDMDTIDKFRRIVNTSRTGTNHWNNVEYGPELCEYMYRKALSFAPDAYITFLKDLAMIYKPREVVQKKKFQR